MRGIIKKGNHYEVNFSTRRAYTNNELKIFYDLINNINGDVISYYLLLTSRKKIQSDHLHCKENGMN